MSGDASQSATPWPNYALPHGTVVNGYRIERVLGSGGFGVTYLARDLLQQPFAIKEYYPRQFAIRQALTVLAASSEDTPLFEECRERFLREAQALVVLSRVAGASDGIVRVQTYFEANGTCFLVMDYVEGASLATVLQKEPGGLAAPRVQTLLTRLLSAIGAVHRAGLMHRDIKPANIILRDDDRVVLIDFGSSREASSGQTTAYTQIYSGGYAPPEQMLGVRQGAFSDIYAIGAVCYRAIGGTMVDGLARQIALASGRADPQPSAAQIGAGRYPASLLTAIDAALTIDATQRPQSADAMLATLEPDEPVRDEPVGDMTVVVARRPKPVVTPPPAPPPQPPARQRRYGAWGVVAGTGALLVIGAAYLALRNPATPIAGQHEVAAVTPSPPPVATPQGQQPGSGLPVGGAAAPPTTAVSTPPDTKPATPTRDVPAAEPPQHEAIAAPPPPPAPAPLPAPQADASAPAPVPLAPPPQTQAMVVPPPPPSLAAPVLPSPLERAQAEAQSVPCSVLRVATGQEGMRVSGFAQSGPDLSRFLGGLHDRGPLADDITRLDRFACGPMAAVAPLVRSTWDATPPPFAIRLDRAELPSGARLGIDVTTTMPALYVDLYQGDGVVRHLLRPTQASGIREQHHVEWVAAPPPGPHLVVAIDAATALDLGARPASEKADEYLAVLQAGLQRSTAASSADIAVVTVRAIEPVVAPAVAKVPRPHPANALSGRCANIVSRAQLGETLSDAERAALRTECRS